MLSFLLTIINEGHQSQVEYIYHRFHDDMLRLAKARLKTAGITNYSIDAEDVVQSSFLRIIKYIDSIDFQRSDDELKAYVFKIVINETLHFINEQQDFEQLDQYHDQLNDDEFYESLLIKERYNEVVQAIKSLDDKYSIVLLCKYYDEMSVREISEFMELSEKTIYTRLERGKRLLISILGEIK